MRTVLAPNTGASKELVPEPGGNMGDKPIAVIGRAMCLLMTMCFLVEQIAYRLGYFIVAADGTIMATMYGMTLVYYCMAMTMFWHVMAKGWMDKMIEARVRRECNRHH